MPDALIYADTFRSPELRHEVPLGVPDPILYAEKDGNKHIVTDSMEAARLAELGLYELHLMDELGIDELSQVRPRPAGDARRARAARDEGDRDHERGRARDVPALARRPPAGRTASS